MLATSTHIYTVDEITSYLKVLIEGEEKFQDIWVRGEISNFKFPSRHLYFSLKDKESLLSCIMFQEKAKNLKFALENGLEVIARGSIGIYKPQGRYQLYVEEAFPVGKGVLYLAFEQVKEELKRKGYFDPQHKVPLPYLPHRIGVVTSPKGAAIRDIFTVLDKRFPNLEIILAPCRVQGKEAAKEIAQGIQNLNEYGKIDVIIVGRGGGSFEDLFAFNEKIVAEAIYNSRIPIISAVGHEIDITISDFVADERAPTPSAAAEIIIPSRQDLVETLEEQKKRLYYLIENYLNSLRTEIKKIKSSPFFKQPYRYLRDFKQELDEFRRRISSSFIQKTQWERVQFLNLVHTFKQTSPQKRIEEIKEKLKREREKLYKGGEIKLKEEKKNLSFWKGRLISLSPNSVLKRGYSICFSYPEGKIIREYTQTKEGKKIRVKLYKGEIYSKVYQTEEEK